MTTQKPKLSSLKPGVPLVRSVERSVHLLKSFTYERPKQTLTELAVATGLDKGTARRLLYTLELAGLVDYNPISAKYSLAVGVLELASSVETGRELREIAAPYVDRLAEQTNATAYLWVHHEGMALCTLRARTTIPPIDTTWINVGARASLNCGGGPRVLMAFISNEERRLALSLRLPKRTSNSQTNPKLLGAEAKRIRDQGWELAIEDFVSGLSGVGTPVFDRSGKLAAALSITTTTSELVSKGAPVHLKLLRGIASDIGSRLLYRP